MLNNLQGLDSIQIIEEDLKINDNPSLINVEGLDALHFVGNSFSGLLSVEINENDLLQNLSNLSSLAETTIGIELENNLRLEYINGFSALHKLRTLVINNCPIKTLHGFHNLDSLELSLTLSDLDSLENLEGLNNLKSCGTLGLFNLDRLQNFDGLSNLEEIRFRLNVQSNKSLKNTDSLVNVNYIGDNIFFVANDSLSSLSFQNLTIVDDCWFLIEDNPVLESIYLDNLQEGITSIAISIFNNPNFSSIECNSLDTLKGLAMSNTGISVIEGFQNISSLGLVSIRSNPNLISVEAFQNIDRLEGGLEIINNPNLVSLPSFNDITFIGGDFKVQLNTSLENLNGVENIDSISNNLIISYNESLADCSALCIPLEEAFIGNNIEIEENPFPCNTEQAILMNCSTSTEDTTLPDIKIFPNPSNGFIFVEHSEATDLRFEIFDLFGRQISSGNTFNNTIQTNTTPGIYIVHIYDKDNFSFEEKIIIH